MLRAYLYGIAWYFIIGVIVSWIQIAKQQGDPGVWFIISFILALVAVIFWQIAKRRKPNRSSGHAVGGWLLGLLSGGVLVVVTSVVLFPIAGLFQ